MNDEQTLAHLEKLDRIVDGLKANPLASRIRIFGSALQKDVPGDIDAFYEGPSDIDKSVRDAALHAYLMLAVQGGYHGNYGYMDPFVLGKDGILFGRNERYDSSTAWRRCHAGTMRAMIAAGRAGTPVLEFQRRFAAEWVANRRAQGATPCQP